MGLSTLEDLPSVQIRILTTAVRQTLAYADIFDYPLTAAELHRYLHGAHASLGGVQALLDEGVPGVVGQGGFYALAGRLSLVAERRRRQAVSTPLVGRARRYTFLLKHLPYVRMIGLTGSLAMNNVSAVRDIDLMVVTAPGRVWFTRAAVIAVVRLARLAGDTLCPNYVVAENSLALDDTTVYSAHEVAQLQPLYGRAAYELLWIANPHLRTHLPNALPHASPPDRLFPGLGLLKRLVERALDGAAGDRLEAWERRRKPARLRCQQPTGAPEIVFSSDQCKGHFGLHRANVLAGYHERLAKFAHL